MFNKLIRDLKKYEKGGHLEVPIEIDDDGFYDRLCPSPHCQADYKVFLEDWKNIVRDEQVFCPICKYEAPASEWNTPEQKEYLTEYATAHLQKVIGNALKEDTKKFNRQQKKGFIQLSMHYRQSPTPIVVPVAAADVMQQKFTCENCGCKYASVGAAFFCPACGHNSALTTFSQTISTIHQIINNLPTLRNALLDSGGLDIAENSIRHILEDSIIRLVGAFQRFTEALFDSLPNQSNFKRRKNLFQNLDESSILWQQAKQIKYEQLLPVPDYDELQVLFQKRHLLAHKNGVIDQEYIDKTGDTTYIVGQRLVIREKDVLRMCDLINALAINLKAQI
jgi:hypothetical protein